MATKQDIDQAEAEFQAAVEARETAAIEYADALSPFREKRKAFRVAFENEVAADKKLSDLMLEYETPQVPPIPSDDEE